MNRRLSTYRGQRPGWVRLLSYVLLFLFAYGSTAEAVHKHGGGLRDSSALTTICLSDGSETTTSTNGPAQSGECVVCQFQQSLSSAAIFTPLLVLALQDSHSIFTLAATPVSSTTTSAKQGRAPPYTF